MYKVVVTGFILQEGMDLLRSRPDLEVHVAEDWSRETAERLITGAHGILARTERLPRGLLALAPDLRVVSRFGVGVDAVDVDYLTERSIPLTVTTGVNSPAVAEHTLGLMLAMAKDLRTAQAKVQAGEWAWRDEHRSAELRGKTVLLIGFGHIAQYVARLCTAFGMRVVAYTRSTRACLVPGVELTQDFRDVLPEADFISLHVPLTPGTHHLLDAEDMGRLKKGAFLVNTGRGKLLDEDLLLRALEDGTLAGVGLDVFENEPADPASPLFRHPRSFFTPHNAGLTHEAMVDMSMVSARNVIDGIAGRFNEEMVYNRAVLRRS